MLSKFVTLFGVCGLAGAQSDTITVGPITITENGEAVTRYVVSTWADGSTVSGSSITMQNGANVQIANYSSDTYDPNMFVRYNLDGATLSFTADYSELGCSCNGAFYFVTMPALDSNGDPTGGNDGSYYCDANQVNGEWCWELDITEANMYVVQTTPHSCSSAPGEVTYYCDGGGCGTNSYYTNSGGFGPSTSDIINTQSPFDFSITFSSTNYHVTMTQNGQTFDYDICGDSSYLSNMEQALSYGMTMILSSWGTDYNTMSWLDSMTGCTGDCNDGTMTFSNIAVTSASGKSLYVDYDTYKKNIMKAKSQKAKAKAQSKAVLKNNSNVKNSIPNSKFISHKGKFGTKSKLSVPMSN